MYKIGKNYEGVVLYLTEDELKAISRGEVDKKTFTAQQWAKIKKIIKKNGL